MADLQVFPEIADYTATELEGAKSWPALAHYLNLLNRTFSAPLSFGDELRLQRHRAWVRASLALFYNKFHDQDICRFWSDAGDNTILMAAKYCQLHKLDVSIFALGKLGAQELNLSSDIDLIFVAPDSHNRIQAKKAVQNFIELLAQPTGFGICHRVDTSIRPGGPPSPLVTTATEFENHYGYHGEAWERLALTRLRPIKEPHAELNALEKSIVQFATSFSYRKHLDYTVLEEMRLLLSRIRSEFQTVDQSRLNLKLQTGYIRDLELFVHALICVHGGRKPELRQRHTSEAINQLIQQGILQKKDGEFLNNAYWKFRAVENRIQAFADEQTYEVSHPKTIAELKPLAKKVIEISNGMFPASEDIRLPTVEDLAKNGFDENFVKRALQELFENHVLSRKTERDERERYLFLARFISELQQSNGNKNLGLSLLVDFIKATRAKASFFSLLNKEPRLRAQLVTLFSNSPWAGTLLCSRPEILDSLLLRHDINILAEYNHHQDIAIALEALTERRLTGHLIAALHFLETRDLKACTNNLSQLADDIASDLMSLVAQEIQCSPIGIVALGKWGGNELGFQSDLDFLFYYSGEESNKSIRLAKRFLNRLTETHRGGHLYSADLRLRPSGGSGPLLVSHDSLIAYLAQDAKPWERQSWLRARSVPRLPCHIDRNIFSTILTRGLSPSEELELQEVGHKLFKPIPSFKTQTFVDLKLCIGGLASIEFAAQIAILREGSALARTFSSTMEIPFGSSLETSTECMIQLLEEYSVLQGSAWKRFGPQLRIFHNRLRSLEQLAILTDHGEKPPEDCLVEENWSKDAIETLEESTSVLNEMATMFTA